MTTSTNGGYSFSGVGPGTYTVAVVQKTGYLATTATTFPLVARSGSNASSLNFAIGLDTFSGEVFNDASGSGILESGDTGLSGWTVDLVNGETRSHPPRPHRMGRIRSRISARARIQSRSCEQSGFSATSPTSLSLTADSGTNLPSENFGEFAPATFSGEVYEDTNDLVLTLTHHQYYQASAWFDTPVSTGSFNASFTYTDQTGSGSADGVAFVLQNDSSSRRGRLSGGGLGYGGITPSTAYEINITAATPRSELRDRRGEPETTTPPAPSTCKAAIPSTSYLPMTRRPRPSPPC